MLREWVVSEDLPASEFDASKQVVTGASLRVQERPLTSRRESQIPLAERDERVAYDKIAAVHNFHAPAWGAPALNRDLTLEVEIADVVQPVDKRELLEAESRAMALGASSAIDLIQRLEDVGRDDAVKIYERVRADMALFPPTVADTEPDNDGPRLADVASAEDVAPDMVLDGNASVLDAIPS